MWPLPPMGNEPITRLGHHVPSDSENSYRYRNRLQLSHRQVQAQDSAPKVITCDTANDCSHRYINGQEFRVLKSVGITVAVAPDNGAFMPEFFSVTIVVTNDSNSPLDVVPSRFFMGIDAPKRDTMTAIAPERVASTEHHGGDYAAIMKLAMPIRLIKAKML
jgi:hypothetical protein